jgi:hypothetical protein
MIATCFYWIIKKISSGTHARTDVRAGFPAAGMCKQKPPCERKGLKKTALIAAVFERIAVLKRKKERIPEGSITRIATIIWFLSDAKTGAGTVLIHELT